LTTAIYLAHLNPLTNSHIEIIDELLKENNVVVMPVRFLMGEKEINSKSFPFDFDARKKMLENVFGKKITISSNYSFISPFKKYFPPLISRKSWSLRKQILDGIEDDYFTYTGDKSEGLMLKLYRLKPKIGKRKSISATSVKNEMYDSISNNSNEWEKLVPEKVVEIIHDNWDTVKKFAVGEDMTIKIAGMKFPKEGYNSK
jgi:nicotinamide mononucleotide adenylyltransferase